MFETYYISEEIVFIPDGEYIFGFVQDIPAICAQGKDENEVKEKIKRIRKVYEERKHL